MNYDRLCSLTDSELAARDVAELNLAAALGLPSSKRTDAAVCRQTLSHWVELVRGATLQWWPKFVARPEEYDGSEGQFRMMALVTVLQRDLGVKYRPAKACNPADACNTFIHGPLSGHGGTSVSLPVLYLAIGRRLGYPLFLAEAKEHQFVRWDDPGGEQFNIDTAAVGFVARDDAYYRDWPLPLSAEELQGGLFLTNKSPRGELAGFMADRALCLMEHLRLAEALQAAYHASQLDGRHRGLWAVATVMYGIWQHMNSGELPQDWPAEERIKLCTPPPGQRWEKWATTRAQQELLRIVQSQPKESR